MSLVPFNKPKFEEYELKLRIIDGYMTVHKKRNDPLKIKLLLLKKKIMRELALEIVD